MTDLLVIVPSYKRPKQAKELYGSHLATRRADSELAFAVWTEDPTKLEYAGLPGAGIPQELMVPRTNAMAHLVASTSRYLGWVADDMRFRTEGWDRIVIDALDEMGGGIVFGNDIQSPGSKPSHVFLSSEIVQTLGWLHHPDMKSTFGDDVWEHLGREMGRFKYLPQITVEHLYTPKENTDDFLDDMAVFQRWVREDADDQVARCLKALRRTTSSRRSASTSTAFSSPVMTGTPKPSSGHLRSTAST